MILSKTVKSIKTVKCIIKSEICNYSVKITKPVLVIPSNQNQIEKISTQNQKDMHLNNQIHTNQITTQNQEGGTIFSNKYLNALQVVRLIVLLAIGKGHLF